MLYDLAKLENTQPGRIKKSERLSKMYGKFLTKSIDEYNNQDLVFYFSDRYKETIGEEYHFSMERESAYMKRLVKTFGIYGVVNLIEYVIRYKRPITIGLMSSGWSNTWYMEMINHYGTSRDTLKYRCLLLSPQFPSSVKQRINWMINQVEESKCRKDMSRFNSVTAVLQSIYDESQCRPFSCGENSG